MATRSDGIPAGIGDQQGRVWITWEKQRRSLNLSHRLGARLFVFEDSGIRIVRYIIAGLKTLRVLLTSRRRIVFVQNPSMVLASVACLLKRVLGYWLVVDRHSSDFTSPDGRRSLSRALLARLSVYTIRRADLTIVTNQELAGRVLREGGRPFVLPDPFPELSEQRSDRAGAGLEILFVCSWAPDEPIAEVVEACRALEGRATVFASGKPKKRYAPVLSAAPPNFVSTGFLPDPEYFRLMARVDVVMALTRRPATLVCGAYEALSLGKPVILGNSDVLRAYFDRGAVYSDCSPRDLVTKVEMVARDLPGYGQEASAFYATRKREWDETLSDLNRRLAKMVGRSESPPSSSQGLHSEQGIHHA
jgi:glycosyltransferase involved in cell wall biosynthesis